MAAHRGAIEAAGAQVAFVHMSSRAEGEAMLKAHGLSGTPHVSDPEQRLYRAFGLERGGLGQLLGPRVWMSGLRGWRQGHRPGRIRGDARQMPGVFLLRDGRIEAAYAHRTSSDRPDYATLAAGRT